MAKVSSSVCSRLRNLFVNKPTRTASAPSSPSKGEESFENLVEKFKNKSRFSGFRAKGYIYSRTVSRLAEAGHFSYIHDILDHQKHFPDIKNERFTSRLLSLYGEAKMLDHSLKLFDEMPDLHCPRSTHSFNALLAACFPSGDFNKAIEIFQELPGKLSIKPDVTSYNTVIEAFCKMGMYDKVVAMLEEMEKNGVDPNDVTYHTIVAGFYYNGRFSEGEKFWNLMKEKEVIPDVWSYNSRIHGMVKEKKLSEALEMLKEMEEKGLEPNAYTYNMLIKAIASEGNIEEVKKLYAKMLESHLVPHFCTFQTLITFACEKDDADFVFELCKKSVGLKRRVSSRTMQQVIDMMVEQSEIEKAKELREFVISTRGWDADKISLPAV